MTFLHINNFLKKKENNLIRTENMDLGVEKNYENSKVKLNVTSELSSYSTHFSNQKLK